MGQHPVDALRDALQRAAAAEDGLLHGVFNFFIVIPQIVVSLTMGWLVGALFGGDSLGAVAAGGASLLLAALATLRVQDADAVPVAG